MIEKHGTPRGLMYHHLTGDPVACRKCLLVLNRLIIQKTGKAWRGGFPQDDEIAETAKKRNRRRTATYRAEQAREELDRIARNEARYLMNKLYRQVRAKYDVSGLVKLAEAIFEHGQQNGRLLGIDDHHFPEPYLPNEDLTHLNSLYEELEEVLDFIQDSELALFPHLGFAMFCAERAEVFVLRNYLQEDLPSIRFAWQRKGKNESGTTNA